ncbi:hypothetical protein MTP04_02620 [Lysinibacillus sp. PLM2]|nr:hypothetical protein MTP04_02620 [Lysinibacillus sp. PLM2]
MILPQKVVTKITSKNVKHYENLGYEPIFHIDSGGIKRLKQSEIEVDVFHLPRSSHAEIDVSCDICEKLYKLEYRQAIKSKNNVCSDECFSTLRYDRAVLKLEKKVNMSFEDFLKNRYLEQMKTTRQIAKEVYGKDTYASTIIHWMDKFNIPLRHGSEAIKTQWINAEGRRKQVQEIAKKTILTKESRDKMKKVMQSKEYKLKSRKAKLGKKNPMFGVRGENHPNWNPELTDTERIKERKSFEDTQWRLSIYRRDRFKCQKCGSNKHLNAHHVLNHKTHKELRYDVNNGVTLCETCHIEFHKTYGYFDNTREQINKYLKIEVTQ